MVEEVHVPILADIDIVTARKRGRELAADLGFGPVDATLIATAISELARNIVQYAKVGEITMRVDGTAMKSALEIVVHDQGPGIPDLPRAMQDGFSTTKGLGLGLPGAKRAMDEFEIVSSAGSGTTIVMRKWLPGGRR